jgi:uncharacterized protein with LGFP repeats
VASLFWSESTGAHVVMGDIRDEYLRHGGPEGQLGYPISDETNTPDGFGRVSYFEHGEIVWSHRSGAHVRLHSRGD